MTDAYEQGDLLTLLPPAHAVSTRELPQHGVTDRWENGKRHVREWVHIWWVWDCSCGRSTKPGNLFSHEADALERGEAHARGEF